MRKWKPNNVSHFLLEFGKNTNTPKLGSFVKAYMEKIIKLNNIYNRRGNEFLTFRCCRRNTNHYTQETGSKEPLLAPVTFFKFFHSFGKKVIRKLSSK